MTRLAASPSAGPSTSVGTPIARYSNSLPVIDALAAGLSAIRMTATSAAATRARASPCGRYPRQVTCSAIPPAAAATATLSGTAPTNSSRTSRSGRVRRSTTQGGEQVPRFGVAAVDPAHEDQSQRHRGLRSPGRHDVGGVVAVGQQAHVAGAELPGLVGDHAGDGQHDVGRGQHAALHVACVPARAVVGKPLRAVAPGVAQVDDEGHAELAGDPGARRRDRERRTRGHDGAGAVRPPQQDSGTGGRGRPPRSVVHRDKAGQARRERHAGRRVGVRAAGLRRRAGAPCRPARRTSSRPRFAGARARAARLDTRSGRRRTTQRPSLPSSRDSS